ncbi:NP [Tilapia parvovirus]|nr:NP [Tilapia parvovirus]UTI93238.1 NP [Tilapia parvovirus]UTI93243.1 NP [Tilapia parvovirus]
MTAQAQQQVIAQLGPVIGGAVAPFLPPIVDAGADKLQSFLGSAAESLSGATTESLPAQAASQVANAPTQEDLSAAPAPQLSTTQDPVPSTDPAIPETEFRPGTLENWFLDTPSNEEIAEQFSGEDGPEVLNYLRARNTLFFWLHSSDLSLNLRYQGPQEWVGKLLPP